MDELDLQIEATKEKSTSQQFWHKICNALVVTFYLACLGTSLTPNNYINLLGGLFMVSVANFILIYSLCQIQRTIKKLQFVILQERFLDIHLMTYCFFSIIFMVVEILAALASASFALEESGKATMDGLKVQYSAALVSNIYFIAQFWVHLFILYQLIYFSRRSYQYKAFDTYDLILGREVPAVVAFNNFELLEKYFDSRVSNDKLRYAEAHAQAQINEYVEAQTMSIAR